MMKVWVMQGQHEGEVFSSVHLTEKGAQLAAIADVLEFLGVEDKETALDVMNSRYTYTETDGEQTVPYEWDPIKLREMTRKDLWRVLANWNELCWDHHSGYMIEVEPRTIQP